MRARGEYPPGAGRNYLECPPYQVSATAWGPHAAMLDNATVLTALTHLDAAKAAI